jgi:hypothetical protein
MGNIARSGPLTWAQQRMWLRSYWRSQGELFPAMSQLWEIEPGIGVAAGLAAMASLARRHEALRTIFLTGGDNLPVQAVLGAAEFRAPVSVAAADSLSEYLQAGSHLLYVGADFARPLWTARLFVADEQVRYVHVIFDHIISDGMGLRNWQAQFTALASGGEAPQPTVQPLDRQRREGELRPAAAPAGEPDRPDPARRTPQVAAPGSIAGPPGAPAPRYLTVSATYAGLLPIVDGICASGIASRSMVFQFALAWLYTRYSKQPAVLFSNYVADRPAGDHGVECQMRPIDARFAVDEASSFATALSAICLSVMKSYEHDIRFGPVTPEIRARTAAGRGLGFIVPVYFNCQGAPAFQPADLAAAPAPVEVTATEHWDGLGRPWCSIASVYLHETDVMVDFEVDVAMVPAEIAHSFLTTLPRFLALAAKDLGAAVQSADSLLATSFAPVTGAQLIDHRWVDLETMARILRSAAGVRDASLTLVDGDIEARLWLEPQTELFDVHEHLLADLVHHLDAVMPDSYVPQDVDSWWPAGAERSGWRPRRDRPRIGPDTYEERELCRAIEETHGLSCADIAASYIEAGGRSLLAPAVVETLCRRGLAGLRSHHFNSPTTLRAAARCLTSVSFASVDGASY